MRGTLAIVLVAACQQGTPSPSTGSAAPPAAAPADAAPPPPVDALDDKAKHAKENAETKAALDAAAAKLEAAPPAQKDDRAPPPSHAGLVWHEHVGVPPCVRGGTVARCETVFGQGTRDKDYPDSVSWPSKGIEINEAHGQVRSVFLDFPAFAGTGDHWIDAKATVEDVLRWYGPPEKAYDLPGEGGVRETSLLYFKRGLYFEFKNDVISQISIVSTKEEEN